MNLPNKLTISRILLVPVFVNYCTYSGMDNKQQFAQLHEFPA